MPQPLGWRPPEQELDDEAETVSLDEAGTGAMCRCHDTAQRPTRELDARDFREEPPDRAGEREKERWPEESSPVRSVTS